MLLSRGRTVTANMATQAQAGPSTGVPKQVLSELVEPGVWATSEREAEPRGHLVRKFGDFGSGKPLTVSFFVARSGEFSKKNETSEVSAKKTRTAKKTRKPSGVRQTETRMRPSVVGPWLTFAAAAGTICVSRVLQCRTCEEGRGDQCRSARRDYLESKSGKQRAFPCHFRSVVLAGLHCTCRVRLFSDAFVALSALSGHECFTRGPTKRPRPVMCCCCEARCDTKPEGFAHN